MTPQKFKTDVQTIYRQAIAEKNRWVHYEGHTHRIFEGITVFGRDAGADLIETKIEDILKEAVQAASAKETSLELRYGKAGKAALAAMVETLGEMTGLPVTHGHGVITIAWVSNEPSLY